MVTLPEAAKRLGVNYETLKKRVQKQQVAGFVKRDTPRGPVWEIDERDLAALEAARKEGK